MIKTFCDKCEREILENEMVTIAWWYHDLGSNDNEMIDATYQFCRQCGFDLIKDIQEKI